MKETRSLYEKPILWNIKKSYHNLMLQIKNEKREENFKHKTCRAIKITCTGKMQRF